MLYFPQLSTGAVAQYPSVRRQRQRTVINRMLDGSVWRYGDLPERQTAWDLAFDAITDEELQALESLFVASAGPLRTFTFLDPFGNLLAESEDLAAACWSCDPGLQLTAGIDDAFGTAAACRIQNSAQANQALTQTLAVPAGYQYCLSLYARSGSGSAVNGLMESAGGSVSERVQLGSQWRRLAVSGRPGGAEESVGFGCRLEPGAVVEVCGLQAEAQVQASAYKRTAAEGGVHTRARFAGDTLRFDAVGPGRHSGTVRVLSLEGDG